MTAPALPAGYTSMFVPEVREKPDASLEAVTLDEFVEIDEAGADALVGNADAVLIPVGGDVMVYGDGGAGKTTLCVDLAYHLAAGDAWLDMPVAKAARVLLVENEGPRPLFRRKLRRKRDAWTGSPLGDRVRVVEAPWARLTFADPGCRQALADTIIDHEIDVVVVGPVTRCGMDEAGTLQEVRDFMALVGEVRELAGRRVTFVLIHHENKGGQVSGAWEGSGDTLLHVQAKGNGRTRLCVQKARWSSVHHAMVLQLVWADGEGFAVEDAPKLDDETLAERILAAAGESPGAAWTDVEKATPGVKRERRMAVRDRLFRDGRLVNICKENGVEAALAYCPQGKKSKLYLAADPAIRHLLPARGEGGEQIVPASGAGPDLQLLPAPRPKGERGGGEQFRTLLDEQETVALLAGGEAA